MCTHESSDDFFLFEIPSHYIVLAGLVLTSYVLFLTGIENSIPS